MPTPGRSPIASAPSAVSATEPCGASTSAMSASRPTAIVPVSSRWTRAVLPVARQTASSGVMPPSDARWAIVRRIPSGTTPVPDGASLPRITRPRAPASRASPIACSAARPLPQWTISIAIPLATSCSMSASGSAVVPPLMWPTMSGRASSTTSARMALDPAIDGPPVWNVETMPCCRAQASIGAACAPVFTEPRPDLADQVDARRGQVGEVLLLEAQLEDRGAGVDLDAGRPDVGEGPDRDDRERLEADDVLGPSRQVHLARRDHRRHAAVELGLDEVGRALARRPVAEHGVDVGVDEARETRSRPCRR